MPNWLKQRIDQICEERGVSKSKLGVDAGLSHATIGKWIKMVDVGSFNPRLEQVEMLAEYTGKPVAWFLGQETTPGVRPKDGSLAAADAAAARLTELDGVHPDQAWLLMRTLTGTETESLYFEARRLLAANSADPKPSPGLTPADLAAHDVKAAKVVQSGATLGRRKAR